MRVPSILAIAVLLASTADAARLVLKRKFAETYKNRATIDATFVVDHAKDRVNTIKKGGEDGDLHIAGRAQKEVGLPMVAEIVNAREQKEAIAEIRRAQEDGSAVRLSGAWRVWFEHPGKNEHVQGKAVAKPTGTNPDHVFEIHPVSAVNGIDLAPSFRWIPGYQAYTVSESFPRYEKLTATIRATKTAITIEAKMIGYNYSAFTARISGQPKKYADCVIATATIEDDGDPENQVTSGPRRLVLLNGMAGLELVKKGAEVRILGIPRLNLERLLDMVEGQEGKTLTDVKLPYEFIVVGVREPQ